MTDNNITFTRSARKELENLDAHIVNRIFPTIAHWQKKHERLEAGAGGVEGCRQARRTHAEDEHFNVLRFCFGIGKPVQVDHGCLIISNIICNYLSLRRFWRKPE